MLPLICPVCAGKLLVGEKTCTCSSGHSFDIARSGYVNLLLNSSKGHHGDDKLMVRSRTEFMNRGYYDKLSREVARLAAKYVPAGGIILDSGCGEGKYTVEVMEAVSESSVIGIDISKEALICAARRSGKMMLCVASSAALPVENGSIDAVLNIFSPLSADEFRRCLKVGGILIRVYPLERHLFELKELIYDKPILNPAESQELTGFSLADSVQVKYRIALDNNADIMALFKMTPYYYKTGRRDQAKTEQAQYLETSLEFGISVYRRL